MITKQVPATGGNAALAARDLGVLWHPCSQMRDHEALPPIPIASAEGAWLTDFDGRRYFDGISSWWVNLFGHRHPAIVAAIKSQLDRLDHVLLAGFSHEPAVELAERLVAITPPGLERVFYADNGSSAIEVALKMSVHCWLNRGQQRTRFIALTGAYHGETLGALSVTDLGLYRQPYRPLLVEPLWAPSPDAYLAERGETPAQCAQRRLAALRELMERHAGKVAAVVVEPLVQCAGGMRMHHPDYLRGLRALCDAFDIHLIADEIAVGFGRTGTLFACEQAGISPDFLCLSKGLTGGFLPLAAVVTTPAVYDAFYADWQSGKAFLHSHSYTGNPIACSAALATLRIFREEPVLERVRTRAVTLAAALEPLRGHRNVADVRQTGLIAAVEVVADRESRTPFPAAERRGRRLYAHGLDNGVLVRPLGDIVYFMPPYCASDEEIRHMVEVTATGIDRMVA
ncbi:adenosylmethionine--8-amino-7-oxononanoate transaminase [Pseudofulvimonas gallinarii]|uniref:Adenosylmethionine-8-amino-7-oxononanoate aminotransferase n=1 Tax=Pseudofulvimonas gallinarii TaxID=634155 RepID=A0A4R3L6I3_9GAMM|nr:adenosylmethionine--8-amino-7-oxononanoate transaminase [Pseudofulvimonas gallinarii]TCS94490.1 adenosylmethionine-8-amino-7-oxononanoate aminotransferase [Pseudofulvimonas gallinarii]THD14534.1 adenosylmethionine--8-amino-7-oxononanoate transaminase [Pseudofulvimonas gallinarii]